MAEDNAKQDLAVARASAVKEEIAPRLLARPEVTGVGVGYRFVNGKRTSEVCIRVYVRKKLPKRDLRPEELLPESIDGVPVDVIEAVFEAHAGGANRVRHNLLQGGISAGAFVPGVFESTGTLGASVFDNESREDMVLSNWHVLCGRLSWSVGDPVVQPGAGRGGDGGAAGDVIAHLHRAALTDRVDGAIARLTGDRFLLRKALALGPVVEDGRATLGMAVRKEGRTTGVTEGTVTDVNATVNVNGYPPSGFRTFLSQIVIQRDDGVTVALPGDSGSVWIDPANRAVGLHFAGGPMTLAIANPIAAVLSALDISFVSGVTTQGFVGAGHNALV